MQMTGSHFTGVYRVFFLTSITTRVHSECNDATGNCVLTAAGLEESRTRAEGLRFEPPAEL
ncbi:unnamed protein product [Clonostachys rosea f. rosea IK726]|uniref:Uncharacterized protein n=1 Tax=Clonostachys rosea f. rosea IK726 TaxID=1349383 RepID=A0ACA9UUS7_BIOOC|nr:unnamed protein product [Clonostachys rosea f. rosea IK726]